jgi:hypothetical protein
MAQMAAKGIRDESLSKAGLFGMLKAIGVVEIMFVGGLVGVVVFVSVGLFGTPIRSLSPGLSTLFAGLYTVTILSAMVLAVRWYVMAVRLMRHRGESSE